MLGSLFPNQKKTVMLPTAMLLLGPTGCGKTPLGQLLQQRGLAKQRCIHFDFGENMRQAVASDRADEILSRDDLNFLRHVLDSGALLEDRDFPIARRLLKSFLARHRPDAKTLVVLNGLPRHLGQARGIEATVDIRMVVRLDCSPDTVRARIAANAGGDRTTRTDDDTNAIARKLAIFAERTAPLVEHYQRRGARVLAIDVSADASAEDIWQTLDRNVTDGAS
jgi:adenylate kinase family enzyme